MLRCCSTMVCAFFFEYEVIPKGLGLAQSNIDTCVFSRNSEKYKPKILVICYVEDCYIVGKPEHVDEMKKKLRKEFGMVKDCQLRKLLGIRYEWKVFELGEVYVVMSMKDKAEENIKQYENYTVKTLNNYMSPGAPGAMLQKNNGGTINMKE